MRRGSQQFTTTSCWTKYTVDSPFKLSILHNHSTKILWKFWENYHILTKYNWNFKSSAKCAPRVQNFLFGHWLIIIIWERVYTATFKSCILSTFSSLNCFVVVLCYKVKSIRLIQNWLKLMVCELWQESAACLEAWGKGRSIHGISNTLI